MKKAITISVFVHFYQIIFSQVFVSKASFGVGNRVIRFSSLILLLLTFSLNTLNTFAQTVTFSTNNTRINSEPVFATIADFNGDGKPDIATTSNNNANVWISLGNGDGTFGTATPIPVGLNPRGVVAADFDGDGKPDLAVANAGGTTISLFKGNGNGTFSTLGSLPAILHPYYLAAADFNKDGDLDIAVTLIDNGEVLTFLGDGNGNFTPSDTINVGGASAITNSLAVADFDGDGKLDLAEINSTFNDGYILKGAGDGRFSTVIHLTGFNQPWQVTAADLNCDGKADLVVDNRYGNNISVLLNNGSGFGLATTFATGSSPLYQTTGDFNGDGKTDIAVANLDDGTVTLLLGDGAGGFSTTGTNSPYKVDGGPWAIYTGDFNMDGKPDLLTVNTYTADVSVLLMTSALAGGGSGSPLTITPQSPSVCAGQSITLSVPTVPNVVWSPSIGLNKTTGDTVIATPTANIVYTATASGGCASSVGTDTITFKPGNALTFTPTQPEVCPGQSVSISVSGGSGFNWNPSPGILNAAGDTATVSLPSSVDSTLYTIIGLNLSGCADTGFITLHSGGNTAGGSVTAIRDTICQGTPGSLSLSGNSSSAIQWQSSTDDTSFTPVGDTTTTYKTPALNESTWYFAIVGSGSCTATSDTLELIVPPALTASFYATQTASNTLTFNSDSSLGNVKSYHWDFGDRQTSNEKNPEHTYTKDTTYYVCLTLYDGSNCSYTFCRYITVINESGIPLISAAGRWSIYPNPFNNQVIINGEGLNAAVKNIEVYDLLGRVIYNSYYENQNDAFQINLSSLSEGIYYLEIKTAQAIFFQPVIKQQ